MPPTTKKLIAPKPTFGKTQRRGTKPVRRPVVSGHFWSQAHTAWKIEYSEQLADGRTWWTSAIYCSDEATASMIATVAARVRHKGQWDELGERVKLIAKELKDGFLYRIMDGGIIETYKGKELYLPGGYYVAS